MRMARSPPKRPKPDRLTELASIPLWCRAGIRKLARDGSELVPDGTCAHGFNHVDMDGRWLVPGGIRATYGVCLPPNTPRART